MKQQNIKVRFALFCDYAMISQDGKLSLLGEFDRLYSTQEKAVLTKGFLVSKIDGVANEELSIQVTLKHENSKEDLFSNTINLKLDDRGVAGILLELNNVQFTSFGLHKAQLKIKDKVIAESNLEVLQIHSGKQVGFA